MRIIRCMAEFNEENPTGAYAEALKRKYNKLSDFLLAEAVVLDCRFEDIPIAPDEPCRHTSLTAKLSDIIFRVAGYFRGSLRRYVLLFFYKNFIHITQYSRISAWVEELCTSTDFLNDEPL